MYRLFLEEDPAYIVLIVKEYICSAIIYHRARIFLQYVDVFEHSENRNKGWSALLWGFSSLGYTWRKVNHSAKRDSIGRNISLAWALPSCRNFSHSVRQYMTLVSKDSPVFWHMWWPECISTDIYQHQITWPSMLLKLLTW